MAPLQYTIDLHNHTPLVADYRGPRDTTAMAIVQAAADARIDVFGVTDHLTVGFYAPLRAAAAELELSTGRRVLVVPGIELRVAHGGDESHLAVLFPFEDHDARVKSLMDLLGVDIAALTPEEYSTYLVEQDPVEVAVTAHLLGGLVQAAHVDRLWGTYRMIDGPTLGRLLRDAPLALVDVIELREAERVVVEAPQVLVTRSSDSHSLAEIGRRTSRIELPSFTFQGLIQALTPQPASLPAALESAIR